jgi:hypothetical protein
MEDVLYQYALPYDPLRPLICFDERPCFLIGEVGSILPMSPGKAKRHHYEYDKNGSCCVLLAFEPHAGRRYVEVRPQRTAVDYAQFMKNLIEKHYPHIFVWCKTTSIPIPQGRFMKFYHRRKHSHCLTTLRRTMPRREGLG